MSLTPATPAINTFLQTPVQGQLDQTVYGHTESVRFDPSNLAATPLIPGQAVKLVAGAPNGGVPIVAAATAATDPVYGFVVYNIKRTHYNPGEVLEIASENAIMYMDTNAAVVRGAKVEVVVASARVQTAATASAAIVGIAIDSSSAAGQLARVKIVAPIGGNVPAA